MALHCSCCCFARHHYCCRLSALSIFLQLILEAKSCRRTTARLCPCSWFASREHSHSFGYKIVLELTLGTVLGGVNDGESSTRFRSPVLTPQVASAIAHTTSAATRAADTAARAGGILYPINHHVSRCTHANTFSISHTVSPRRAHCHATTIVNFTQKMQAQPGGQKRWSCSLAHEHTAAAPLPERFVPLFPHLCLARGPTTALRRPFTTANP